MYGHFLIIQKNTKNNVDFTKDAINDHFQSETNYTQKDGMTADTVKLTARVQLQGERWPLLGTIFEHADTYFILLWMSNTDY